MYNSLLIAITHFISGLSAAWILDVSSQKEFSEKVISKTWIYAESIERNTHHRQSEGHLRRCMGCQFLWGGGNFIS